MSRIVYLGTPDAAVAPLRALVAAGHEVALVVSRADARRGRGPGAGPSPVKAAAQDLGVPVTDDLEAVAGSGAELGVVVAFGRIIPARLLEIVPMVNLHFSLLPRWRGAAPVERAVLAGDHETGVCLMRLDAGLDTGPVLDCRRVAVGDLHVGDLLGELSALGAALLLEHLQLGVDRLGPGTPQVGEPTYADKLRPEELRLDWAQPADLLARVVRLDRAWTTWRGTRLRVLDAVVVPDDHPSAEPGTLTPDGGCPVVACGRGALQLRLVQPEGRRPMDAPQWANGARLMPGERLGADGDGR